MDLTGASTAIMIAFAAVLWFLYFVPTWIRRREHLATERTATRLQQTMRVLAETAELPETVRVEASAREAARQERIRLALERQATRAALRDARAAEEERREIERERALAQAARATTVPAPRGAGERAVPAGGARVPAAPVAARLRRTRRAAGLLLLAALAVAGVQLWLMATTGVVAGSWVVLAGCVAAGALSLAAQGRVRSRLAALRVPAARAVRSAAAAPVDVPLERPAGRERVWTPVPLPKPLYVEHPEAAPARPALAAPAMDHAAVLRVAAAEAERALRAAEAEPEVARLAPRAPERAAPPAARPEPAPPARASRYASMGIVDPAPAAVPDLDEVLRRRRNAG